MTESQQTANASPQTGGRQSGSPPQITTDFDWLVYADATFAGLSVLIPIPFVDALLEEYFRRRMPRDIARRRGRALPLAAIYEVNRKRRGSFLAGCLMLPLNLIIYVIRNLYRTIVYVLSVVDASNNLSRYWHRAFLLDYMIGRGHLDNAQSAAVAAQAMHRVLENTQTSPMFNLAQQIIETASHQIRNLMRAIFRFVRRREETDAVKRTRISIAAQWAEFRDYLIELAGRYDAAYDAIRREQEAAVVAAQNTRLS